MVDIPGRGDQTERIYLEVDGNTNALESGLRTSGTIANELRKDLEAIPNAIDNSIERLIKFKAALEDEVGLGQDIKTVMESIVSLNQSNSAALSNAVNSIRELLTAARSLGVNGNQVLSTLGQYGLPFGGFGNMNNMVRGSSYNPDAGSISNPDLPGRQETTINGIPESIDRAGYARRVVNWGKRGPRVETVGGGLPTAGGGASAGAGGNGSGSGGGGGGGGGGGDDGYDDDLSNEYNSRGYRRLSVSPNNSSANNPYQEYFKKNYPSVYDIVKKNNMDITNPAGELVKYGQETLRSVSGPQGGGLMAQFARRTLRNYAGRIAREQQTAEDSVYGGVDPITGEVGPVGRKFEKGTSPFGKHEEKMISRLEGTIGKFAFTLLDKIPVLTQAVTVAAFGYNAARAVMAPIQQFMKVSEQYGSMTGANNQQNAMGLGLQAMFKSGFGLNPFVSSQDVVQAQMAGMGLGYQGNANSQYVSYALNNLARYGLTNQASQQYAQAGILGGMSLSQVGGMIGGALGGMQGTNTSTAYTNQAAQGGAITGAGIGLNGAAAGIFGQGSAMFGQGNQFLQQQGVNGSEILNTQVGTALLAQQLGVGYMEVAGKLNSMGNNAGATLLGDERSVAMQIIGFAGIEPGLTKGQFMSGSNPQMLQMIGQSVGLKKSMDTPKAAAEYFWNFYSNQPQKKANAAKKKMTTDLAHKHSSGWGGFLETVAAGVGNSVKGIAEGALGLAEGVVGYTAGYIPDGGNTGQSLRDQALRTMSDSGKAFRGAYRDTEMGYNYGANAAQLTLEQGAKSIVVNGKAVSWDNAIKEFGGESKVMAMLASGAAQVSGMGVGAKNYGAQSVSAFLTSKGVKDYANATPYATSQNVSGLTYNNSTHTFTLTAGAQKWLTQLENGSTYTGQKASTGQASANTKPTPGSNA